MDQIGGSARGMYIKEDEIWSYALFKSFTVSLYNPNSSLKDDYEKKSRPMSKWDDRVISASLNYI